MATRVGAVDDRQRRPAIRARRASRTRTSSWSAATPGRPTRSGATSASSAASTPSASPPPTTSTRCSRCSPTAWSTTRCGRTSTSSSASSRPASTWSAPPRSSTATGSGADRDRIVDACERGGSSMFGSGVSPGFIEVLAIVTANVCDRIDKVTVIEEADTTLYDSPDDRVAGGLRRDRSTTPSFRRWPHAAPPSSARRSRWSPMRSASSSTRSCARPSSPRPPRTSTSVRGQIPAGHVAGVLATWQGASAGGPSSS